MALLAKHDHTLTDAERSALRLRNIAAGLENDLRRALQAVSAVVKAGGGKAAVASALGLADATALKDAVARARAILVALGAPDEVVDL